MTTETTKAAVAPTIAEASTAETKVVKTTTVKTTEKPTEAVKPTATAKKTNGSKNEEPKPSPRAEMAAKVKMNFGGFSTNVGLNPREDNTVYTKETFVKNHNGLYPNGCLLPFIESQDKVFEENFNKMVVRAGCTDSKTHYAFWSHEDSEIVRVIDKALINIGKNFTKGLHYYNDENNKAMCRFIVELIKDAVPKAEIQGLIIALQNTPSFNFSTHTLEKENERIRDFYYGNNEVIGALVDTYNAGKLPADIVQYLLSAVDSTNVRHFWSNTFSGSERIEQDKDPIVSLSMPNSLVKFGLGLKGVTTLRNYIANVTNMANRACAVAPGTFGYYSEAPQVSTFEQRLGDLIARMTNGNSNSKRSGLFGSGNSKNLADVLSYKTLESQLASNRMFSGMTRVFNSLSTESYEERNHPSFYRHSMDTVKFDWVYKTVVSTWVNNPIAY